MGLSRSTPARWVLPGLLALVALGVSPPAPAQQPPRRSVEEWAGVYNDPKRAEWQKPDAVIEALELKPHEAIADIGAGTGYFAARFARHVATVYAVDIDPEFLAYTAQHAPANVQTVLAAPDDPKLSDASVDAVFFCDVVHHLRDRVQYFRRVARALRSGGRVVVIDFHKRPLPVGPPERVKLTPDAVSGAMGAAGYRLARQFDFLPYQYFLVFQR